MGLHIPTQSLTMQSVIRFRGLNGLFNATVDPSCCILM